MVKPRYVAVASKLEQASDYVRHYSASDDGTPDRLRALVREIREDIEYGR